MNNELPKTKIDEEYRTTLINFAKYHLIMFTMAKIMEMTKEEQNQVALYLFNSVNPKACKENIQKSKIGAVINYTDCLYHLFALYNLTVET